MVAVAAHDPTTLPFCTAHYQVPMTSKTFTTKSYMLDAEYSTKVEVPQGGPAEPDHRRHNLSDYFQPDSTIFKTLDQPEDAFMSKTPTLRLKTSKNIEMTLEVPIINEDYKNFILIQKKSSPNVIKPLDRYIYHGPTIHITEDTYVIHPKIFTCLFNPWKSFYVKPDYQKERHIPKHKKKQKRLKVPLPKDTMKITINSPLEEIVKVCNHFTKDDKKRAALTDEPTTIVSNTTNPEEAVTKMRTYTKNNILSDTKSLEKKEITTTVNNTPKLIQNINMEDVLKDEIMRINAMVNSLKNKITKVNSKVKTLKEKVSRINFQKDSNSQKRLKEQILKDRGSTINSTVDTVKKRISTTFKVKTLKEKVSRINFQKDSNSQNRLKEQILKDRGSSINSTVDTVEKRIFTPFRSFHPKDQLIIHQIPST